MVRRSRRQFKDVACCIPGGDAINRQREVAPGNQGPGIKGVLVLSEFTGAARELTEALIVNPYDLEAAGDALALALTMSAEEQQDRMRSMRSLLAQFNVYRWAGTILMDAARLRNQERVTGRLTARGLDTLK